MLRLRVAASFEHSSQLVAAEIEAVLRQKADSLLGLSTGSSVVEIYRLLVAHHHSGLVNFSRCQTINMDEYIGLGQEHPQSFAHFMRANLFVPASFNPENTFLFDGAAELAPELRRYDERLAAQPIDLLLLGVGTNGHVGFNEPDLSFTAPPHVVELSAETIAANARHFAHPGEVPRQAVTVGMRDIARAEKVILIASGAAKADAMRQLFADDAVDPRLPCSILKLCRNALVVTDRELASLAGLQSTPGEV